MSVSYKISYGALSYLRHCVEASLRPSLVRPAACIHTRSGRHASTAAVRHFTSTRRLRDTDVAVQTLPARSSAQLALSPLQKLAKLPTYCPGCGAPTQNIESAEAGYYPLEKPRIARYLARIAKTSVDEVSVQPNPPNCERCHNLHNHSQGVPIFHPSIRSIQDIIAESPHVHNHIYHVVDAADFPLSLIPNLQQALRLPRLRSQNRRSKTVNFAAGRIAEVSFIITRADLLAPRKEQVDALMPYLRSVLRDALSVSGRSVRLGNVRCVSAQRGWWTREVKHDIWRRGGAGWLVGKVNVGKSNLYHVVFPKGHFDHDVVETDSFEQRKSRLTNALKTGHHDGPIVHRDQALEQDEQDDIQSAGSAQAPPHDISQDALLPPARSETPYPAMPLISSLPGTTASPIRIPFGNGKGELIDLPGTTRSTLDQYVIPDSRSSLVMRSRVKAEQLVLKPGQSLLLGGGLVRITPIPPSSDPDLVFLAHPFVPLSAHVTSTVKALDVQSGTRDAQFPSIVADYGTLNEKMTSSGPFELKWDVTKLRAGALTDSRAGKMAPDRLPFTIWSADVIVGGVGWVEMVAQVRKKHHMGSRAADDGDEWSGLKELARDQDENVEQASDKRPGRVGSGPGDDNSSIDERVFPAVEVFSPDAKAIALRPPMGAFHLGGRRPIAKWKRTARPRKSMRSVRLSDKGRREVRAGQA